MIPADDFGLRLKPLLLFASGTGERFFLGRLRPSGWEVKCIPILERSIMTNPKPGHMTTERISVRGAILHGVTLAV
jgi:hypothetical protein